MSSYATREEELRANLAALRSRIAAACARRAGSPDVTLIAVTKTRPVSDIGCCPGWA